MAALLGLRTAAAQTAPAVTVEPAWEAYYRAGRGTEIRVRAASEIGGRFRAAVADAPLSTSAEAMVEPGETVELVLPVRPAAREIVVTTRFGIEAPTERTVELTALSRPILAVVADGTLDLVPWLASDDDFTPLPVAAAQLPRTRAGYEPVAVVVAGSDIRAGLGNEQRRAFEAYLSDCGRVLTLASEVRRALAATAGCGGRFVVQVTGPVDAAVPMGAAPGTLPSFEQLRPIAGGAPKLIGTAALFLALYCGIVALLAGHRKPGPVYLIAVPVLASLLMLAVWYRNAPESRLVVWLEQRADEPARYRAVLDVLSQGVTELELPLAPELGLPASLTSQQSALSLHADRNVLSWQPALLSRQTLGFSGGSTLASELSLDPSGPFPAVVNRGSLPLEHAILAHAHSYYRVPALGPGQRWAPDDETPSLSRSEVPRPLTGIRDTAVLVPLPAAGIPAELPDADVEIGYLVTRLENPRL